MLSAALLLPLLLATGVALAAPSLYPGAAPGSAQASVSDTAATLSNDSFSATYHVEGASVTFGGLQAADGTTLIEGGTPLFSIHMKDGSVFSSTNMKGHGLSLPQAASRQTKSAKQAKGSKRAQKKAATPAHTPRVLRGTFVAPDDSFAVVWDAILADDSHYLRHSLAIRTKKPLSIDRIVALDVNAVSGTGSPTVSGNTSHGCVVVNEQLFFGLETPMSLMSVGGRSNEPASTWTPDSWTPASFGPAFNLPPSFKAAYGNRYAATKGPVLTHLRLAEGPVNFARSGSCTFTFRHKGGNQNLNLVGVQLLDAAGKVVSEDVHESSDGSAASGNSYTLSVPEAGKFRLRYWTQTRAGEINSRGEISISLPRAREQVTRSSASSNNVQGCWKREAALAPGQEWRVTSVIGLFAPGQKRRSFLAYIERERAVPYRPFVHYNDWYEIGIRVHDHQDPKKRTSEAMWMKLLDTWHKELFIKRRTKIDGFVIDDGWDDFNSLWDFHCGFPSGFSRIAKKARRLGAGIGTWLGPVGGYGSSKRMRLNYWNSKHPRNKIDNFQLSNAEYFDAFVGRCTQMIKDYNMRYFKFDGISTKFHAKGPENIEDAEGIINVIRALRQAKPDVFINATVGTWASPFWYMHADSTWRQENDFDQMGNAGDPRDRWITYRDRLVHEVYVQGAPLCPLNSLMTHGTMITKNGPPHIMSRAPENCRKEIRMAFGCGSALQEIYADHDLLNQNGGVLWDELAANIAWVRRNADVLPDVHWVGGNPWDGQDGAIYGYAAWNNKKATLTLRNSSAREKTLRTTLREVLDVPPGIKGTVEWRNSFEDQRELGLTNGPLDVDETISITLRPMEVIVLEGNCVSR